MVTPNGNNVATSAHVKPLEFTTNRTGQVHKYCTPISRRRQRQRRLDRLRPVLVLYSNLLARMTEILVVG